MSYSKKVDRLSQLPEDIVSDILSLMPTKFAVRTSVLSKRWRYAWTFAKNLDFYEVRACEASFQEFVDGVLKHCKTPQISVFSLHLPYDTATEISSVSSWIDKALRLKVSSWIDKAVRLKIRELQLTTDGMYMCELPMSLFTCNTLTKLTIAAFSVREFTCPVNLPSLKILDIAGTRITLGWAFKFISGSPMLECLSLLVTSEINVRDYTFNIPTLKRFQLKLCSCQLYDTRVVLNVPSLEYLVAGEYHLPSFVMEDEYHLPSFVMEDVSSLVEASISSILPGSKYHLWDKLLDGVSGVKTLSIGNIPPSFFLPIFPNLMHLELKRGWPYGRIKIFQFLESCPQLKHLYIEEYVGSGLRNPKSVPACMLTNLTTIKFSKCRGSKFDLQFLGYVLGNAKALKKVTITWDNSRIEEQVCAKLLKRKRASRCCEIHFPSN